MTENWRAQHAETWARTVLCGLRTEHPYAAGHVSLSGDDVDVTPAVLHPAFHGCLDWHSSAHMQWSAVRLLTVASSYLTDGTREDLVALLDERLDEAACATEATYLRRHPRFERPYGWGWVSLLAAATAECPLPRATRWAAATAVLARTVEDLVLEWLPRLAHPVRHGEHANTAFGLTLVHQAAVARGREVLRDAVSAAAVEWFAQDRDYPVAWEPGGSDFLSPALCEADLMRRVLPPHAFPPWLAAFLPSLGGANDPLLGVPEVRDRTDGKAVHLFGLALSRAWQLRLLAPSLPQDARARVTAATERQVASVQGEIAEGDFMSTHWLVSFALLALDEARRPERSTGLGSRAGG